MLQTVRSSNVGRFVASDDMTVVGGSTQFVPIVIELVHETIGTKRLRAETRQQKKRHQHGNVFSLRWTHDCASHFQRGSNDRVAPKQYLQHGQSSDWVGSAASLESWLIVTEVHRPVETAIGKPVSSARLAARGRRRA